MMGNPGVDLSPNEPVTDTVTINFSAFTKDAPYVSIGFSHSLSHPADTGKDWEKEDEGYSPQNNQADWPREKDYPAST
jgi:hypothetical protein